MKNLQERLGEATGVLLAPLAYLGSYVRDARVFHPQGLLFEAAVKKEAQDEPLKSVAENLSGRALVRLSSAIWRDGEHLPDVLGCAIRFGWLPNDTNTKPLIQDLLFATFKRAWTLPFATLSTNVGSYLANNYFTVVPYQFESGKSMEFRLVPEQVFFTKKGSREALIRQAVLRKVAVLHLQARSLDGDNAWEPVLKISLLRELHLDQRQLRFSPFNQSLGLEPQGFLQYARKFPYFTSQAARRENDASH